MSIFGAVEGDLLEVHHKKKIHVFVFWDNGPYVSRIIYKLSSKKGTKPKQLRKEVFTIILQSKSLFSEV